MTTLNLYGKTDGTLKDAHNINPDHLKDVYLRTRYENALVFWGHNATELLAVPLENISRVEHTASLVTNGDLSALANEAEYYAYMPPVEINIDESDRLIYIVKYYTDDLEVNETIEIYLDPAEGSK